jgi:hypothetical protein
MLNGISSAIQAASSEGDPSAGMLALSVAFTWTARASARRLASLSSDCTQIRASIRCATSRRPAPSPSMTSSGQPAGTLIDPARPCSAHRGGRKLTARPWRAVPWTAIVGVLAQAGTAGYQNVPHGLPLRW